MKKIMNWLYLTLNNLTKLRRKYVKKRHFKNILLKIRRFFVVPNNYNAPRSIYLGTIKIKTRNGSFKMKATGGSLENEIFWKGIYNSLEPETVWIIGKLSLNANCIIDIGANTGLYSLFVKAINAKCNIHAFEPSKNTFKELKENILLNRFDIYANNFALSNKNGFSTFYDTLENHQYSASLSPMMLKEDTSYIYEINEYMVEVMTLDYYVEKMNIKIIDVIKIDVELHEPEVFEGMVNTLSRFKPFILFEVLINEIGAKLRAFLMKLDYEMFHFTKNGKTFNLVKVEELTGRTNKDWNYFACHKERIRELEYLNLMKE
jgi:FkbM family methyltransferase